MLLSSFAQAKNIAQQTAAIEQIVNIDFFILTILLIRQNENARYAILLPKAKN